MKFGRLPALNLGTGCTQKVIALSINQGVPAETESGQPKVIGPKVLECAGVS